jgi:ribosomal-protein-alanine N-acetyltransferase
MTSLETPRLLLHPPAENDFDAFYRIWTEPDVRRFLWDDEIISDETAREAIAASIALFQTHQFGIWSVIDKSKGELIGFCGFRFVPNTSDIELLYGIRSADWGKGLTTEAARAAI